MFTLDDIKNWLFIDIETASEFSSLDNLRAGNPMKAKLWSQRCDYLRKRYSECYNLTEEELYAQRAPLHPEFARIVCVCVGIYQGDGKAQVVGFSGVDEKSILTQSLELIRKFCISVTNKSHTAQPSICGHNIKRFDVPLLCKRALINKLELPELLQVHNKKPWEMPFVDTAEIWSFGTWQESFASLELLTNVLDLQSPKEDLDGSMVQNKFWIEHGVDEIKKYCQNDVLAVMNVILDLSSLEVVPFDNVTRV